QRRLLAFEGGRVERCACALERGLDRLRRRLEDRGGFVGMETEHVAQYERRALLRRQLLQRDDERERDPEARCPRKARASWARRRDGFVTGSWCSPCLGDARVRESR